MCIRDRVEALNWSGTVEVGLTSSGYLYLLESSIDLIIEKTLSNYLLLLVFETYYYLFLEEAVPDRIFALRS